MSDLDRLHAEVLGCLDHLKKLSILPEDSRCPDIPLIKVLNTPDLDSVREALEGMQDSLARAKGYMAGAVEQLGSAGARMNHEKGTVTFAGRSAPWGHVWVVDFCKLILKFFGQIPIPKEKLAACHEYLDGLIPSLVELDKVRAKVVLEFEEARCARNRNPVSVKQRGKSGPKIKYNAKAEKKLADDWEAARRQGAYKVDFARDNGHSLKDFDGLLARVRSRKSRPN